MFQNQKELNLFEYQKKALDQIFLINSAKTTTAQWKILILDESSRLILQNYYTVKDLRDNLITLELMIDQNRTAFQGITAIYFVEPTKQNRQIIIQDAKQQFYTNVQIHFTSDPGADTIPILAQTLAKDCPKSVKTIKKIDYVNINFHSIDKNIALLRNQNQISSLISNLQYPPVFIYQPQHQKHQALIKTTKQILANKLHTTHKDNTDYCTAVVVVPRDIDYEPVFLHDSNYSSLTIDTCQINGLNRLKIQDDIIALDSKNNVWGQYKYKNIAQVAKKLEVDFSEAQRKNNQAMSKVNSIKQSNNSNVFGDQQFFKYDEIKKLEHSQSILNKILQQGISRRLNQFCQAQQQILNQKQLSGNEKATILQLLKDKKAHDQDKIRFMLIYMLNSKRLSSLDELQKQIENIKKPQIYLKIRELRKAIDNGDGAMGLIKDKLKGTMGNIFSSSHLSFLKQTKKFSVTKLISLIIDKGIQGIKKQSKMKVMDIKNGQKIKSILVIIIGGIDFKQHLNIVESTKGFPLIYAGDKIAKASELFK